MAQFGVINHRGECTPVSNTMRGAKNYATRHGYYIVGQISKFSMTVFNIEEKINGKWKLSNSNN